MLIRPIILKCPTEIIYKIVNKKLLNNVNIKKEFFFGYLSPI